MTTLSSQHAIKTISPKQLDRHITFIDPAVDDYLYLAASVRPGIEVIILDSSTDGVLQISEALANLGDRTKITSLHIISHGSEASLQLGATQLNAKTLWHKYADAIESWRKALSDRAEILLYGCNVATGQIGQDFVEWLSLLTGATVAASTNSHRQCLQRRQLGVRRNHGCNQNIPGVSFGRTAGLRGRTHASHLLHSNSLRRRRRSN
ncbi:MAG: DUF4347 domain-containing protein [Microcoleus sp. SM1_3_4]|nr:DUF4347 domain-containing protein [Microcoleus sp. SM1_3_4]